jgi:hypothetical protein
VTTQHTTDVAISGGGGFYLFALNSEKARKWARRHVQLSEWQMFGDSFCCDDTRYAMDLADAMTAAGLRVE